MKVAVRVSGSIAVSGFSGSASIHAIIREGALITPRLTTETGATIPLVLRVTSVVAGTNLITASYGSTTFTTISTTCTWYVIAQPYQGIIDASDDISKLRTKKKNFMQIFERAVVITQSRKGMDMEAVVDELQDQIKQRTLEIKRELDMSIIHGVLYASGAAQTSGDIEYRTMAGLIVYIADPDLNRTVEDTTVTSVNGALTISDLNGLLYKMWDEGGL